MKGPPGLLRRLFPTPFVAIVALMLVLIVLTPSLLSIGGAPPVGSVETDAELLVYCPPSGNATELYVEGIGAVPYASITVSLGRAAGGPAPSTPLFNFTNRTVHNDTLIVAESIGWDPVAVNVTAVYVDPSGAVADFIGTFEFNVTAGVLYYTSYLPSVSSSNTPLTDLPLTFLLESVTPPRSAS